MYVVVPIPAGVKAAIANESASQLDPDANNAPAARTAAAVTPRLVGRTAGPGNAPNPITGSGTR
jgi:hypothetical protein